MKGLTDRQESGIDLEKPVSNFLEQRMKLGSRVDHNSFNPSQYGQDNHNIVDIVVKDKALIECTNPKETTFMNDSIMNEKLDYCERKDPKHSLIWILLVSFAVFSTAIMERIKRMGAILIVLNLRATRTNFRTVLNRLYHSKLYQLAQKFNHHPKFKAQQGISPSLSPSYSLTTLDCYSVTRTGKVNNYLYQHTDPSEKAPHPALEEPNRRFEDRERFPIEPRFNH